MDPAFVLLLSSLMQLQQSLEAPLLATSAASTSAPLMFFTLVAVVVHAAAVYAQSSDSEWWRSGRSAVLGSITNAENGLWALDPAVRDEQWRRAYGMSYPLFAILVEELAPFVQGKSLGMPVDAALAMVLYRLAHGHSARRIAGEYRIEPWEVARITNAVTKALATKIYPKYVTIPCGQRLVEIVQGFRELTGLPNMCGAIDGSHIKLHKRPDKAYNPSFYRCRHHFFSVLLQAVCDHNGVFWDVCVKAPGATDDATHLRESSLFKKLIRGEVLVESGVTIRGNHIRPFMVGDCGYPLLSFLLTPFTTCGTAGTPGQNGFDACLMKGRDAIEHGIGLLKGRWRILQNLNVGLGHAAQTIVACCVLHNMCVLGGEPGIVGCLDPQENGPVARPLDSEKSFNYFGESLRQALLEDMQERQNKRMRK